MRLSRNGLPRRSRQLSPIPAAALRWSVLLGSRRGAAPSAACTAPSSREQKRPRRADPVELNVSVVLEHSDTVIPSVLKGLTPSKPSAASVASQTESFAEKTFVGTSPSLGLR